MSHFFKDELYFVKELPEYVEIECPVCLNILSKPHQVTCCGHNFCEDCIERVKASNGPCPMCKERRYQSFIDKKCLRIINLLKVYCTNKERGCQWKGELKNLSTHLNKGKREGECQYEEVSCKYWKCEEKKQRQHLDHHEKDECHERPFRCEHCNTRGTYHSITEEHYMICLQYLVLCPNQCTLTQMPRGSVAGHVDKECPLQPVDCVFSWAGCKERPLRKDIELHISAKHIALAVECGQLQKENEQTEMEDQSASIDHTNNMHPILPINITPENGVVHFYTDACGCHMSAKLIGYKYFITYNELTILLALHKDKFNSNLPKIYAQCEDRIIPLIADTEANYKEVPLNALENITRAGTVPPGVIKQTLGFSLLGLVSIFIK